MKSSIIKAFFVAFAMSTLIACGGGGESSTQPEPIVSVPTPPVAPVLQSFSLLVEHNPDLEADLEFALEDDTFSARLPSDISVKSMIPTFTFSGKQVVTDDEAQISGETSQDIARRVEDARKRSFQRDEQSDGVVNAQLDGI